MWVKGYWPNPKNFDESGTHIEKECPKFSHMSTWKGSKLKLCYYSYCLNQYQEINWMHSFS